MTTRFTINGFGIPRAFVPCFLATLGLFTQSVLSQVTLDCSAVDSSGMTVSGGALTGVSAGGQGGGVATLSGGSVTLYSGFLGCFALLPGLDSDGDGLADELDSDNDNDALSDAEEVEGSAFSPTTATDLNIPDSDGDGSSDGDEAAAMTNPQDAAAFLRITESDINQAVVGQGFVRWFARDGATYRVYGRVDGNDLLPGTLLDTVTASGGAAPWFETTADFFTTNISVSASLLYHVEKVP